jgi:hypothetical protein
LKLLKHYYELSNCWTSLNSEYESNCTKRQMLFKDKFFTILKVGSINRYLAHMKEAADQMEEVEVGLLEKIVVYHTLKNLPREFNIIKQIILSTKLQPNYHELEPYLLNK